MLFSRKSPNPEMEDDSQDAWSSSAFPPVHDQLFDQNAFGRMDFAAFSSHGPESVGADYMGTPTYPSRSFAAASPKEDYSGKGHSFPSALNSPTHDGEPHEKDGFEHPAKEQHPYRSVLPGEITPYLGLRARLTQVPINRWTILILLVLARMWILFDGLSTDFTSAQQEATSACSKVEDIGSTLASMPHYMSQGVNELIADSITNVVRALISVLMMIIHSISEIIMFVIEFELGTIACLFDLLIDAILGIASDAVQKVCDLANEIIHPVMTAIQATADFATNALGGIESDVAVAAAMFHLNLDFPDLSGIDGELSKLENFSVDPRDLLGDIAKLQHALDLNTIMKDIEFVVDLPFDIMTTLLNESYGNWTMSPSLFPVANKVALTFCTGNDMLTDFFDILFTIAGNARVIASTGLCLLATLAAVAMAWWEVQRYRRSVVKAETLRDREPMDVVYLAGRPLTACAGLWVSEKVSKDPKRRMLIRWCVAYATTYTALFVLSLAVAGLFSVLCQYIVMLVVQKEAPGLAAEVGDFVSKVVGTLEGSSQSWANESNSALLALQDDLNDHVFGFVKTATGTVENAIDKFVNATTGELQAVFGNTSLYRFVDGLVNCTIINKLEEVSHGLEWVHEHARVSFPEFPSNLFYMGANDTSGGSNSSLASIVASSGNDTANEITGAVAKIITTLRSNIITEGLIAIVILLIYFTYVLFAVAQAALRMCVVRDHRDEPPQRMYASESQKSRDDDEQGQLRTFDAQRQMPRRGSVALSTFSDFDIADALDEKKFEPIVPVVEAVNSAASVGADKEEITRALHVELESRASDDEDEDPFGDNAFPAEKVGGNVDVDSYTVQALRGPRDIVGGDENGRSLTSHRASAWGRSRPEDRRI